MKVTRVYHDEMGETHFEAINIRGEEREDGFFSERMFPSSMVFREYGNVNDFDWHNAPQRLYIVILEGKVQVEVSDGSKRIFEKGDTLLMEDTEGKGHKSSSPDGKGRSTLMIFLDKGSE